jgi:hypothetical protein
MGLQKLISRFDELETLLEQCLLPDWVRLGRRLG